MLRDYSQISTKKKYFLNIVSFLFLLISSFISWNYFGLVFFFNGVFLYYILDKYIKENFTKFIIHSFLFVLSWKLGALFWMFSIDKGFFGFLIINILSLIPFILFYFFKRVFRRINNAFFIFFWMIFEVFNNLTSFSFPWLTLGNIFSTNIYLVQWYKFTGVLGGSIWFLVISFYLFTYMKKKCFLQLKYLCLLLFPLTFLSFYLFFKKDNKYIEKTFITFNNEKVSDSLKGKDLAFYILKKTKNIDHKNKVLLIPESTFRGLSSDRYEYSLIFNYLNKIITENGFKEVFFGTTMYKPKEYISNASVFITEKKHYKKVKEKLIIFNEFVPNKLSSISSVKKFNPNADDSSYEILNDLRVLPVICYEAFYSYYLISKKSNAKVIYLLSSEKFFNNSFYGSNQYNNILKLRSVENGIPLIKSSNSGESLIINSKGRFVFNSREELSIFEF